MKGASMRHLIITLSLLLAIAGSACSSGPSNAMLTFDEVEDLQGLNVQGWLAPETTTEEALEGPSGTELPHASFDLIENDPFSASAVFEYRDGSKAEFNAGTYRFFVEVYGSGGPMYYGCEQTIEIGEGDDIEITISTLPVYTGDTWWYMPWSEVAYPECPSP